MSDKKTDTRFRNFATVVYPESAPEHWMDIITEQFIPAFISPLHDKDVNPTGEIKKAHYHVVLMFDGKKSMEQVKAITELFGGVGCEKVNTIRGYARYLCHLDNPEKYQYPVDEVVSLCGADYMATIGLPTDKYKAIREMMAWCRETGTVSYSDLLDYASVNQFDWFRILCDSGTVVMKEYLKSLTWTQQNKEAY